MICDGYESGGLYFSEVGNAARFLSARRAIY